MHAVNGVDFHVAAGEAVGLVGESGSGKSTIGMLVTRLIPATAGTIRFDGRDITSLPEAEMRPLRARLQIVFQDPWGALNPRMTIARALEEPLKLHTDLDRASARAARVRELAQRVHLPLRLARRASRTSCPAASCSALHRARARHAAEADRARRADQLARSFRARRHPPAAGRDPARDRAWRSSSSATISRRCELITDRVLVLYLGNVVEEGATRALFAQPAHPYTQTLLSANLPPDPDAVLKRHAVIGETPSPIDLPRGLRIRLALPGGDSLLPAGAAAGDAARRSAFGGVHPHRRGRQRLTS